jgi:carbon monoxide dehydrogenase subunit G
MIEAEYAIDVARPVDQVWHYVEDLQNWAPFMIGFQRLTLVDDRRSIWTLRGDVGVLSREVEIQADITRWDPPSRAEFTITGLTERISGQGSFELISLSSDSATLVSAGPAAPARDNVFRRVRWAVARWLLRVVGGRRDAGTGTGYVAGTGATSAATTPGPEAVHSGQSRLSFRLEVAPGGPMAPMVELLMRPMVEPAAQDFLREVRQALEQGGGRG